MDAIMLLVDRGHPSQSNASNLGNTTNGTHIAHASSIEKHQHVGQNMLVAWIVLQLAGQVTLPILIATLLFHKRIARRNPTIINLCIVWTLATIPPEILFYTGDYKGPEPSTMLCLFQAATISGVPPMAATAYLAVVIHACTVVYEIINSNTPRPFAFDLRMILLLGSPYISFFTFALFMAVVGAQNPDDVQRKLFFCEIMNHNVSVPVFLYTVIIVIFTLTSQFWIAGMFYRHYRAKRRRRERGDRSSPQPMREIHPVEVQLLIRMVAFTIFEIVIVVSSVSSIFHPRMGAAKLLLATPPFAVFLIFSSSRDIYHAWFPCFFRRRTPKLEPDSVDQEFDTKSRPFVAYQSMQPPPPSESSVSRYSQQSFPFPPPAMTTTRMPDRETRDGNVDLEKALAPEREFSNHAQTREYYTQPQETSTTLMVLHRPSSSASPDSALDAIRTFQAPAGARLKARLSR